MRILLVEDYRPLADSLASHLRQERFIVECCHDGKDANLRLGSETYDLVILDLGLPGMDGQEVLRRMRARGNGVPVLILSSQTSIVGRVDGLDSGADDFLCKPFDMLELLARMRVLLRRQASQKMRVLTCGALSFDRRTRLFWSGDYVLSLTRSEHALLEALFMRQGEPLCKRILASTLFTLDDVASAEAVKIYVHRLRAKLEGCDVAIVTVRGLGYVLRPATEMLLAHP